MKKTKVLILALIMSIPAIGFGQSKEYLVEDANQYFKAGRYWDAFFLYRNIAKVPEYQGNYEIESQIKNSSRAMYLWKKTEDFRVIKKYDLAKENLSELIRINPSDPNRGQLPRITLEHASDLHKQAWSQRTYEATNEMLQRAMGLYQLAMNEGLKDESIRVLIRQCEVSMEKTGTIQVKQPTSYGINNVELPSERTRSVQIIKN
jgi:tetratricopeptide (TPR) repeat protein